MAIGDYCRRDVHTVDVRETLREAARKLADASVGSLVVTSGDAVAGMLTDRDVALETLARGRDPDETRVADLLGDREAVVVHEGSQLGVAAGMMRRHALRRLPVLDEDERLVGVIAADDLLRIVSRELAGLVRAVEAQSPGRSAEAPAGETALPEVE